MCPVFFKYIICQLKYVEIQIQGGTAVDAVEKAVNCMEDDPNFNAGHGAVLNEIGLVECDAMIMDGSTLNSGQRFP